ncbi:hypothetical protein E4U54_008132 [Claviceps lovelessii]|nr:hypothetical protein E4U54_008132 [Claviceps lovelessii]
MLRAISWTALALAPVAHARFGRRPPGEISNECCPCPAPGLSTSNGASVITVTQPPQTVYVSLAQEEAPTHTVTVECTVTVGIHTVYVTQLIDGPSIDGPSVSPRPQSGQQPGPQTVPLIQGNSQGDAQGHTQPPQVTTTVQPESLEGFLDSTPKTVTVTMEADPPVKPVAIVPAARIRPSLEAPLSPSVVTGTQEKQQQQQTPAVITVSSSPEPLAANTAPASQPQGPKTVVVTVQPSPASAQPAAVTASLQAQTIVQTLDHYATLTKSVSGGHGGDNIEIIIINIFTGETVCMKKHSGESCHGEGHVASHRYLSSAVAAATGTAPSQMPFPSVNVTTSAGTIHNTGTVILPSGNFTGAAQPTGSRGSVPVLGRKPRGPLKLRKW